jgi:hypothetical protein
MTTTKDPNASVGLNTADGRTQAPRHQRTARLVAVCFALCCASLALTASGASTAPAESVKTVTVPLAPLRILDSRDGTGTAGQVAAVGATETITLQVAGVGPVPTDAAGVVLNVTGTNATSATYITAYPTGTARSTTSVLNVTPGVDIANTITVALGDGGALDLYNSSGTVDLIADVTGYLVDASSIIPPSPGPPTTNPEPTEHVLTVGAYAGSLASGEDLPLDRGCMRTLTDGEIIYDVPLPEGAVVTSADVHYYDGSSRDALTVALWYSSWADPANPTLVGQPTAAPDNGATWSTAAITVPTSGPLDAPSRFYLHAYLGGPLVMFCGADIHYTL